MVNKGKEEPTELIIKQIYLQVKRKWKRSPFLLTLLLKRQPETNVFSCVIFLRFKSKANEL